MSNKYHRQSFVAGKIVKAFSKKDAAKKAAEKIKKILKMDTAKFGLKFKKMTNIKKMLNKPAVDEYNKKVKEIKSRVTKGESKEDMKDLQSAADKLNNKLFKAVLKAPLVKFCAIDVVLAVPGVTSILHPYWSNPPFPSS